MSLRGNHFQSLIKQSFSKGDRLWVLVWAAHWRATSGDDYPMPDPSWDYSKIYGDCQQAKFQLEKLIGYMSQVENATPETDSKVKAMLDEIGQRLNQARQLMDE